MALPSRPGEDAGRSRAPRVLVIALVVQLALAGVAIFFALTGWPWVGGGRDAEPVVRSADSGQVTVPSRFQAGAEGDGVPTPRVDRFDAEAAFALLRRQVDRYGWRPAGSASLRRLAKDLRARLPRGALEPVSGHPGLQNVVGRIPGAQPAIVLGAHYDVEARPRGFVGANDGAAGTAAVVEIARALARRPVPRGAREIRIARFDGEEEPPGSTDFQRDALRGSKDYVRRHGDRVGSMVLLDYIANRGLRLAREGTSDSGMWSRMRSAASRVGVARSFPSSTATGVFDDHTPFLDAGIPAIDLIDFAYPWRDGLEDTVDKVTPRSLDVVGEATIEMLLRERLRGVADPRTYTGSR
jgi:hypothetical protein